MSPYAAPSRPLAAPRIAVAAACLLAAAVSGCDGTGPGGASKAAQPLHRSFDAIPEAPLQGKIRGTSFAMKDARYRIDRRPGYEKVDLTLSAGAGDGHCAALKPADAPSVWLRRKGVEPIAAAELRLQSAAPAAWEVHYQIRVDGQWVGSGQAAALLRLRPSKSSTTVAGELSACFADGHGSCVAGSFEARQCPVELDMPVRGNEPVEQLPPERKEGSTPDGGGSTGGTKTGGG